MVKPWIDLNELDTPTHPYAEDAVASASFILWALSGRKYHGTSEITEQYVCPQYDAPAGCSWDSVTRFTYYETGMAGYVVPFTTNQRSGTRFSLRQKPVNKILSVEIDGEVLPESAYYLRDRSQLVIDPQYCSSLCDAPVVTYSWGVPPPVAGRLAAIELANELVLDYEGSSECQLPSRITSVQRQGLSIQVYDPQEFLDEGKLGLFRADTFLQAVNPYKTKKRPKVFSVDIPRGHTRR